ncbi:type II toxin-antitoxin system tRNA(fMet)-specific endonuclease VapC [Cellvibrio mixtus]|uniref:type II toxin-antitoxin system tRNA(fMet)-specific endonuclease VapC n=1 Tax=Cellvibrio mixtus TaxID=39650 RepID=UPI0005876B6F|nr:type II toxin-antitoxin system VapC family toxin [Cellvibrio mixtus]
MSTRFLLDTNICIYIAKYNPPAVRERFQQYPANQLAMSIVTLGELRFGAKKSHSKERAMTIIDELANLITIADLCENTANHYGDIRASLQKSGQLIGNNDLWIAAHARSQNWILVTNKEKEFLRVDGLSVENWG